MQKVCLVIIDGWGHSSTKHGNAILNSDCRNMDMLKNTYGCFLVCSHGENVGLLEGQAGNSEVGHLTIGAGRVVEQDIRIIKKSISTGELCERLDAAGVKSIDRLHFVGLVSDGSVHSHIDILKALLLECKERCREVFVHFISDGRDTKPRSFEVYLDDLELFLRENKCGRIASVCGRQYAMDRDGRDERTRMAYEMMAGLSPENQMCAGKRPWVDGAMHRLEGLGLGDLRSDEMLHPCLLDEDGVIRERDTVFLFNYRADRMKQIAKKFCRRNRVFTLTEYDRGLDSTVIFKRKMVESTLCETISLHGIEQVHVAESEKKAHVTYFLNGGAEESFPNERRIIVPSPSVEDYSTTPEMSMGDVCKHVIEEIGLGTAFVVCNLAAPDMVGHTGDYDAAVLSAKATDEVIGKIYEKCVASRYILIVTADHGNCEVMIDGRGNKVTKHTANKVPLIICDSSNKIEGVVDSGYSLKDVAPTVLKYLGLAKPDQMTGTSVV